MKRVPFSTSVLAASVAFSLAGPADAAVLDVSASLASSTSAFNVVDETFTLPSDFSNPVLDITTFAADDRAVMLLNGSIIASTGIFGPGTGSMVLTDGGSNDPFTFQYGNAGPFSPIATGFVAGLNTLNIVVNNTQAGIFGGLVTPSSGDPTSMTFEGTVTFDRTAVIPLPASALLLLGGLGMLGGLGLFGGRNPTTA